MLGQCIFVYFCIFYNKQQTTLIERQNRCVSSHHASHYCRPHSTRDITSQPRRHVTAQGITSQPRRHVTAQASRHMTGITLRLVVASPPETHSFCSGHAQGADGGAQNDIIATSHLWPGGHSAAQPSTRQQSWSESKSPSKPHLLGMQAFRVRQWQGGSGSGEPEQLVGGRF